MAARMWGRHTRLNPNSRPAAAPPGPTAATTTQPPPSPYRRGWRKTAIWGVGTLVALALVTLGATYGWDYLGDNVRLKLKNAVPWWLAWQYVKYVLLALVIIGVLHIVYRFAEANGHRQKFIKGAILASALEVAALWSWYAMVIQPLAANEAACVWGRLDPIYIIGYIFLAPLAIGLINAGVFPWVVTIVVIAPGVIGLTETWQAIQVCGSTTWSFGSFSLGELLAANGVLLALLAAGIILILIGASKIGGLLTLIAVALLINSYLSSNLTGFGGGGVQTRPMPAWFDGKACWENKERCIVSIPDGDTPSFQIDPRICVEFVPLAPDGSEEVGSYPTYGGAYDRTRTWHSASNGTLMVVVPTKLGRNNMITEAYIWSSGARLVRVTAKYACR